MKGGGGRCPFPREMLHQHPQQLPQIHPIRLYPPKPTTHLDARRVHHQIPCSLRFQVAMQPKPIPPGRVAGNRVCILEWPYQDGAFGPPLAHRMKPEELAYLFRKAGFRKWKITDLSNTIFYRLEV